jgi:hypothetical protein
MSEMSPPLSPDLELCISSCVPFGLNSGTPACCSQYADSHLTLLFDGSTREYERAHLVPDREPGSYGYKPWRAT